MKRLLAPLCALALLLGAALGPLTLLPSRADDFSPYARRLAPAAFANLGTPSNGSVRYCSDCAATSPCTGSGTGANASRVNGAWNCSGGGEGTSLPVTDSTAIAKGSSDATKQFRFEADTNIPTATTVVGTLPASSFTFARSDAAQTFTGNQRFDGQIQLGGTTNYLDISGSQIRVNIGSNGQTVFGGAVVRLLATGQFAWSADGNPLNASDTGFARSAAAEVAVTDGSTGRGALYAKTPLSVKTANYTVTVAETGKLYTNEGAAGTITFTLPTPAAGLKYGFCVVTAQALTIVPATPASEGVYVTTLDANDSISSSTVGHCIELKAVNATTWMATSFTGSWP